MGQAKIQRQLAAVQFDNLARQQMARARRRQADQEFAAALAANPEIEAWREASLADEELQARWRDDAPGQSARLLEAGWRKAIEGTCGNGGWGHPVMRLQMLHDLRREEDGSLWAHVSVARAGGRGSVPAWEQMRDVHWLMYPDLPGVQVMAPRSQHVNLAEVLHVWTRLDAPSVPDFGRYGTI
jgi:hypothetical protein